MQCAAVLPLLLLAPCLCACAICACVLPPPLCLLLCSASALAALLPAYALLLALSALSPFREEGPRSELYLGGVLALPPEPPPWLNPLLGPGPVEVVAPATVFDQCLVLWAGFEVRRKAEEDKKGKPEGKEKGKKKTNGLALPAYFEVSQKKEDAEDENDENDENDMTLGHEHGGARTRGCGARATTAAARTHPVLPPVRPAVQQRRRSLPPGRRQLRRQRLSLAGLNRRDCTSRWRDCHFADALSRSLLKHLLKEEGSAAE